MGSVIPTVKAIIPAAVGVDIGCGMMAVRTSLKADDLPQNLKVIESKQFQLTITVENTRSYRIGSTTWKNWWRREE